MVTIHLWQAIAQRYANEPQIAAYDLLNEPQPSGHTLSEGVNKRLSRNNLAFLQDVSWEKARSYSRTVTKYQTLMQQVVDTIRSVDQNHLIIVERVNWMMNADGTSPLSDFTSEVLNAFKVTVNDNTGNLIYDFHYYPAGVYVLQPVAIPELYVAAEITQLRPPAPNLSTCSPSFLILLIPSFCQSYTNSLSEHSALLPKLGPGKHAGLPLHFHQM
ncbi:MAG: glycoside hydrolase family 5 protein [Nitrospiria bacterium]